MKKGNKKRKKILFKNLRRKKLPRYKMLNNNFHGKNQVYST